MCTTNHGEFARPGYLIDPRVESIAAGVLFTRMLANHAEVGLTGEQITALLDVAREYHEQQVAIRVEFARVTEQLEIKWGRLDAVAQAARKALLDEHAELFRRHEELFFLYAERGHDLLSDEQIDRAEAIYHAEKDQALADLATSLRSAVGPNFTFQAMRKD
jgi:hypothetical protein